LAARNIELICPHRRGRKRPPTQDGRPLRRFRRRWIVERTISWLQAFRRLITRHEFYSFLYHSFAKLACIMIVLRRF
jgi:transposase